MITRTVRWAILHLQTGRGVKSSENAFAITQEYSVQDLTSAIRSAVLSGRKAFRHTEIRFAESCQYPTQHGMLTLCPACTPCTARAWDAPVSLWFRGPQE